MPCSSPPESTECHHKNHAYGEVGISLNGNLRYAAGSIIDEKGESVSIEVANLMTVPTPKGAHR
jgi:hypothetical protein